MMNEAEKKISENADKAETIHDIIYAYCEGIQIDWEDIPIMVGKITALVARRVREDHNEDGGYVDDAISLIEDME
jgi:hypothetical protein